MKKESKQWVAFCVKVCLIGGVGHFRVFKKVFPPVDAASAQIKKQDNNVETGEENGGPGEEEGHKKKKKKDKVGFRDRKVFFSN